MIVKVHSTPNGRMLAICDSGILGKVFEEGEHQLDLSASFYRGEEMPADRIMDILRDVYIVNAVGKESVGLLVEKGLVEKDNVKTVSGVPYAQCVIEH